MMKSPVSTGSLLVVIAALCLLWVGCNDDPGGQEPPDAGEESDDGGHSDADVEEERQWPPPRPGCNGHPDLCDRPFDQVVFAATHNAMSNAAEEWGAPNQNLPLRAQLIDGIRVFLLDTYEEDGEILMCHSWCQLGSRPLLDAMEEFRSFLDENPDEIITIIFEDHIPGEKTVEVLEEARLVELVYTHDADAGWPTLGEMIAADTRLVVTNERAQPPPEWMHHVWHLGWDTPFSFSDPDEFNCDHNRGTQSGDLFLINHWILDPLPRPANAEIVNSYDVLMERVDECQQRWGRLPTFIAIDFHDIGDIFEVVDELNELE